MDSSYIELKSVTDKVYKELELSGGIIPYAQDVMLILAKYGIRLRQKDGNLTQVNISIPKSVPDGIMVGLRYVKVDGTKTEDLFLSQKNNPIKMGYKGKLEKMLTEYAGSHKLQR